MRRLGVSGMLLVVAACMLPSTASALRLKRVAGGFVSPVHVASNARDPAGTLFVVEQEGRIWRVRSGRKTLFLDIRGLVSSGGERGMFSVAFPPGYERTRRFYVNYTDTGGDVRVARFRANSSFTRGVHRSRRMLLDVEHSSQSNHNGGLVSFGPNGRLYVSIGDGGGGCDPAENAQNLSSRKGKLLSIDAGNLRAGWRIDGYGLRNPWRYSFDRATGRLHLADVGQGTWEELNALRPSRLGGTPENYLWDRYEGRQRNTCDPGPLRGPGRHIFPVHVYDHSHGRCSITGGHVYRGRDLARRLRGWYFYGDFCSGEIWRLRFEDGRVAARRRVADTDLNIPSFGEGKLGSLYVVARGGSVYRLVRS